ncbi:hypothetical protein [Longirhabdus pacifica]|uniref:hypothetical protein n=1 Tax=Longirhabdus pacifica TaxID=2305227 RepID=UPI001008973B|nr:hypothetical protein [Longirhabdus pacifica]
MKTEQKLVVKGIELQVEVQQMPSGHFTTVRSERKIDIEDSIALEEDVICCIKVYSDCKFFAEAILHTWMDQTGTVIDSLEETAKIIGPFSLFKTVENEPWVMASVFPSEKEYLLPLRDRESLEKQKGKREFVGHFVGYIDQQVFMYAIDSWDNKKQDKLRRIHLEENRIISDKIKKVPKPINNKVYIHDNEIHVLKVVHDEGYTLHRQIDIACNVLQERKLDQLVVHGVQIMHLHFDRTSHIVFNRAHTMCVGAIHADGTVEISELFTVEDIIYNIYKAEKLANGKYLFEFRTEMSRGWFVVKEDKLHQCFIWSEERRAFIDQISHEVIDFSHISVTPIIKSYNRIGDYGYSVICTPPHMSPIEKEGIDNEIYILTMSC